MFCLRSRSSLSLSFVTLASIGIGTAVPEDARPVRLGAGEHRFEWVRDWVKLPDGMHLGNTHGCIAVDAQDRIYVNTDSENAVIVFDADGNFIKAWGKELAGGLHGMTLVEEDGAEFLYLAHTGRQEVLKTTLDGEVLWRIGIPERDDIYADKGRYRPTAVAVCPDGRFFVADGYGTSWIHAYAKDRTYENSVGGPGSEEGQFRTPHGMALDPRGTEARILVADRENHRLQLLDLKGKTVDMITEELRRPCNAQAYGDVIAVADLAGRVTLLDKQGELITHLGENPDQSKWANNGVPVEEWRAGEFIAPHGLNWDSQGNLYVLDWVSAGRITKLRRLRD